MKITRTRNEINYYESDVDSDYDILSESEAESSSESSNESLSDDELWASIDEEYGITERCPEPHTINTSNFIIFKLYSLSNNKMYFGYTSKGFEYIKRHFHNHGFDNPSAIKMYKYKDTEVFLVEKCDNVKQARNSRKYHIRKINDNTVCVNDRAF